VGPARAIRSLSPQCAVDGGRDVVRLDVHLVLGKPVHAPLAIDQPGVAAGVVQHPLGSGVVRALVLDADAVLRVGEIEPDGAAPDVVEHGELRLGLR
jgi:hypothetical protein